MAADVVDARIKHKDAGPVRRGKWERVLDGILLAAQTEQKTGRLTFENDSGTQTALWFVSGRLSHAASAEDVGDNVVVASLRCGQGKFVFDEGAGFDGTDTVQRSIPELIAMADRAD